MKKIAFVLACILTISICLAGCQETEFDTGEGTPVFSLDANEISAVTFQNGNTAVSYTHLDVYKRQEIPGKKQ